MGDDRAGAGHEPDTDAAEDGPEGGPEIAPEGGPAVAPGDEPGEPAGGRKRWPWILAGAAGVLGVATVVALVLTISPEAGEFPEGFDWDHEEWDGALVPRTWSVGVPDGLPAGEHPAIVLLHGLTGTRTSNTQDTDIEVKAADAGVVLALPQGLWGMWNAGQCCAMASLFDVNDVGFIDAVLTEVAARPEVDPDRVYVVGASNGGLMAVEHLCRGEVQPAGVAVVTAIPFDFDGCERHPVPMLIAAGEDDPVFPFDGGRSLLGTLVSGRASPSWEEMGDEAAEAWGCSERSRRVTFEAWTLASEPLTTWTREQPLGCDAPLTLTSTANTVHSWVFGGDWSHTKEVMDFFDLPQGGAVR